MASSTLEPVITPSDSASTANDPSTTKPTITIGTRRSVLARVQTDIVVSALRNASPENNYVVHPLDPLADRDKNTPLHSFNAKSLWTHDFEALLLEGGLDLIVHSLKDMPTQLPHQCTIGAIFPREDPRDALVVKSSLSQTHKSLASLPPGSVIGTSSLRRSAQLKRLYPHLAFADMRGNVGTRLAKLDAEGSQYAALILAAAGLKRLGMGDRITALLSKREGGVLHAVGQGAIGVEIREDDSKIQTLLEKLGCERTTKACLAERSLMCTLEGGCSVPIGVETEWVRRTPSSGVGVTPAKEYHQLSGESRNGAGAGEETNELIMRAVVVSLDGQEAVEGELTQHIASREAADQFGRTLAALLVERGAGKILEKINLNRDIIEAQGDA